ncbi:hypothetical protein PCANC_04484 [Puccinia coronata f. sp. avenae]|uniref:Uncharacterized protein n=1 Tax=Puccinia coronata f. sp. avenae TaxID=200324 RepID=A0A2N5VUP4_9BASI|nr:hypothetical protein PCASD_07683 [Puccinia coronata f. sp. avenae]PLW53714.1 hypothetical protein PCANC_04484 [Puccinia coronata f. sp. avenae]
MSSNRLRLSTKTDADSSDSTWIRCPRSPCLVSYKPKNARRHLTICRYFPCSNEHCNFTGTQKQIHDHESGCPYGLRSEEIGTTDPLSDSPSEVLDILTSPHRVHSYPTDPSSGISPHFSSKKHDSNWRPDLQSTKPHACDESPIQSSSKLTDLVLPSASTVRGLAGRSTHRRSIIDPYDPSAKRIFSLPADSINPDLKPVPPPASNKCSSPAPPPPTRRLATYELQRYRPEPPSMRPPSPLTAVKFTSDCCHEGLSAALAHKSAQLEAVHDCYSALLKSFDDVAYSISQNRGSHELQDLVARMPLDEFDRVLEELAQDAVPDRAFLDDIKQDAFEGGEDDDAAEDKRGDKENRRRSVAALQDSPEGSCSPGYHDPQELPTAAELTQQVRLKIAGTEPKTSPLADSPNNVFGRKRKRDADPFDPECSRRPTRFVHKLADTTLDLGDEIQSGLPSCCNLNKLIQSAKARVQARLELRNQRLDSP